MDTGVDERVEALREGRAFVRPPARAVAVRGADAEQWLNDLVTAGVEGLADGASVRSLILSPTGRIRAEVYILRDGDAFVLVQSLDQPEPVDRVLAPYVLSSAVELSAARVTPVLLPADGAWRAVLGPPPGAVEVDPAAAERWRVEAGVAVFPLDLDADSLPAEAGLDVPPVTDTGKGCFLGQESVARVRNLGHPTRLVRAFSAAGPAAAGDAVLDGDREVGTVTSGVDLSDGGAALIARVRWEAREAPLRTAGGVELRRR
jgi:tRNA-modifying protein YgfZ